MNKKHIVVFATGLTLVLETAIAEEDTPHLHIETSNDISAQVMLIKSAKIGFSQDGGRASPRERLFTLSLHPEDDQADILSHAFTLSNTGTVGSEAYGIPSRKIVRKVGTALIKSTPRFSGMGFMALVSEHVALVGKEGDFDRLRANLQEILSLPTDQAEATVKSLREGHTVWIGHFETYDENSLPPSAETDPAPPSLRQFSYEDLIRFGMGEASGPFVDTHAAPSAASPPTLAKNARLGRTAG